MPRVRPSEIAVTNAMRQAAPGNHPSGVVGSAAWRQQVSATEDRLAAISRHTREDASEGHGVIAIDPGDRHVGVAVGVISQTKPGMTECLAAFQSTPSVFLQALENAVTAGWVQILVVESFALDPSKAMAQTGSEMWTSQMIGAVRWMAQQHNRSLTGLSGAVSFADNLVQLVMQRPDIKRTTNAFRKNYGIPFESKGSDHAQDAELHFWHLALRQIGKLDTQHPPIELAPTLDFGWDS